MTQAPKRIRVVVNAKGIPYVPDDDEVTTAMCDLEFSDQAPFTEHFYTLEEPMTQEEPKVMTAGRSVFPNLLDRTIQNMLSIEMRETESLAWAFMKETGLPPSEIEMVRRHEGEEVRFYFQKKSEHVPFPDPSKPVEDEYENDWKMLWRDYAMAPNQVDWLKALLEKHYVRKDK